MSSDNLSEDGQSSYHSTETHGDVLYLHLEYPRRRGDSVNTTAMDPNHAL